MAADDFFQRWAKRNAERNAELRQAAESNVQVPAAAPEQNKAAERKNDARPTLDDVAALTPESDYSPFVARGIDETVQRSAMKKLFSDPHFNVMDGLDTYIDDYNKFEPIPPEMLALLNHAKDLLNPLAQFEKALIEKPPLQLIEPDKISEDDAGQESAGLPDRNEVKPPPENLAASIPEQDPIAPAQDVPIHRTDPA